MSQQLVSGQTSEDLLADFESILEAGGIDLDQQQIVIISTPGNVDLHPATSGTGGEMLLFATPQGPRPGDGGRRPTLGRPPVNCSFFNIFFYPPRVVARVMLVQHFCVLLQQIQHTYSTC